MSINSIPAGAIQAGYELGQNFNSQAAILKGYEVGQNFNPQAAVLTGYNAINQGDTCTFTSQETSTSTKTTEEKQAIMKKARCRAAGSSALFSLFSTLYFGLRSDKTIAKKYGLDPEADKEFINNIRQQQVIQTIPSLIPGIGGGIAWIYNKLKNPDKLKV